MTGHNFSFNADLEQFWQAAAITLARAGFFSCSPTWSLRERILPTYQIWIITDGAVTLSVKGRASRLGRGAVCVIPPYTMHSGKHDPANPLHCYVIHFMVQSVGIQLVRAHLFALPLLLHLPEGLWTLILELAEEICREVREKEPGYMLIASGAVAKIVGYLWRVSTAQLTKGAVIDLYSQAKVARTIAYVNDHFAEQLSLADLAKIAGLTPSYFSAVFHKTVGVSPMRYLLYCRLRAAKEMLSHSDATVSEIAARVGFLDPLYFSRVFKRVEGVAPTEWRRLQRSTRESAVSAEGI